MFSLAIVTANAPRLTNHKGHKGTKNTTKKCINSLCAFVSYWSLAKLISVAFHAIFRHELSEFGEFFLFFFVKFVFIRVKIKKTPVSSVLVVFGGRP